MKLFHTFILSMAFLGLAEDATSMDAGKQEIQGTITERGVVCPRIKLKDGSVATLMGVDQHLAPGTKVRLEGLWTRFSTCQQGPTFHATATHILTD